MQNGQESNFKLGQLRKSPKFYDVPFVTPPLSPEHTIPKTPHPKADPVERSFPLKSARSWVELFQSEIDKNQSEDCKLIFEHPRSPS